jgi:hypothetical protein
MLDNNAVPTVRKARLCGILLGAFIAILVAAPARALSIIAVDAATAVSTVTASSFFGDLSNMTGKISTYSIVTEFGFSTTQTSAQNCITGTTMSVVTSGFPLEMWITANIQQNSASQYCSVAPLVDGAPLVASHPDAGALGFYTAGGQYYPFSVKRTKIGLSAGSHTVCWTLRTLGGGTCAIPTPDANNTSEAGIREVR